MGRSPHVHNEAYLELNKQRIVNLGFWERSSLVWQEEAIKDHQDRLSRQTAALQLLLTAIQWYDSCQWV
jgi:hypothetical protein